MIAPGVQVIVSDDLCKRNAAHNLSEEFGSQAMIIGACSQLRHKLYFWDEVASKVPYSIRVIDILGELSMSYDSMIVAERIKLLLWAQVTSVSQFKPIYKDNLKLAFSRPGDKVNRREFLVLPLPRYEIVPFIESSKCAGGDRCHLCYDNCLLRAVTIRGNVVTIDNDVCNGCGACVAECPRGAVYYPTCSFEELDSEMEGLLLDDGVSLEPRIVAVSYQTCPSDYGSGADGQITYPPSMLPLKIPCLSAVSPWLMLRAFDMGAQGLAIVSGQRECRSHFNVAVLKDNIEFVQAVLEYLGVAPERIELFEVRETNVIEVADKLGRFAAKIMGFDNTVFKLADRTPLSAGGLKLSSLVAAMSNRLARKAGVSISKGAVPFGKVILDGARCTGCGLCAMTCPTDALALQLSDGYQLLFYHGSCVSCGICVNVCPEKCIKLQRILEIDKICRGEPIFFDSIIGCRRCGKPVAPMSMITSLRSRLQKAGIHTVDQLELCPVCKAETVCYKTIEKEDNVASTINKSLASKGRAGLGGI